MATLNPSNVVNGNIIQASDVLQLFEAFGTGSQNITGLSMTGSLKGIASTASFVLNAVSSSYVLSSSYAISSSYALSSSIANGAYQVNSQNYDNGSTVVPGDFKFIAGKTVMTSGAATSSLFTVLAGKVIGDTVWINAAYPEAFTLPPGARQLKVNVSSSGVVLISGDGGASGTVIFTGTYI